MNLDPVTDLTRRNTVVQMIRRQIVSGAVAPGQKLTETDLANQLGVSRAVLREAIRELVASDLLVALPYRGLYVREFTRRDLTELYSLRTALEKMAFTQAWARRTPAALAELERRHAALVAATRRGEDPLEVIELELALHDWCYELSDHRMLAEAWNRLKPNLQFYFALHQRAHNRPGPRTDAHEAYVTLASGGDLAAMLDHLEHHMRQGLERTLLTLTAMERDTPAATRD